MRLAPASKTDRRTRARKRILREQAERPDGADGGRVVWPGVGEAGLAAVGSGVAEEANQADRVRVEMGSEQSLGRIGEVRGQHGFDLAQRVARCLREAGV